MDSQRAKIITIADVLLYEPAAQGRLRDADARRGSRILSCARHATSLLRPPIQRQAGKLETFDDVDDQENKRTQLRYVKSFKNT